MKHLLTLFTFLGVLFAELKLYSMSNSHTYPQVAHETRDHIPNNSQRQAARVQKQLFTAIALGDSAMVKQALQNHADPHALFEKTCRNTTADATAECTSWMCNESNDNKPPIIIATCLCSATTIPVFCYFKLPILLLTMPGICFFVGSLCHGIKYALGGLCSSCTKCLATQQQLLTIQNHDTPLLMACRNYASSSDRDPYTYTDIIKLLLEANAETQVHDVEDKTPLQLVLSHYPKPQSIDAARLLCLAGADIYSTNKEKKVLLPYLFLEDKELLLKAHQTGAELRTCSYLIKKESFLNDYLPSTITPLVISYCLPITENNDNPFTQFVERLIQNDPYLAPLYNQLSSEPLSKNSFPLSPDYLSLQIKNMDFLFQGNDVV